jgi:hypothetical protein
MNADDIERFAARVMTAVHVADVQAVIREAFAEARQPFLDLADDLDDGSEWSTWPHPGHEIAARIRAAARGDR